MNKVLLLEDIDAITEELFKRAGFDVNVISKALSEEELLEIIGEVDVLGIRSKTNITPKILENAKKLKALGVYSIGLDQISAEILQNPPVSIFNSSTGNTRSVVEMVLGEIIMLSRQIFSKSMLLQQGKWQKTSTGSHEINGRKLGIIGYGNIGSQLGELAANLGMEVYFYDLMDRQPVGNAKKCQTLAELLTQADTVSLHVHGGPKTKNYISEREFAQMKQGVIFLNFSRGSVVNMQDLVNNLKSGKIAGAGIDVFLDEPKTSEANFKSELIGMENVIITPHMGGSTEEAQIRIAKEVTEKVLRFLETGDKKESFQLQG